MPSAPCPDGDHVFPAIGGGAAYLEITNDIFYPRLPFAHGDRIAGIYHQNIAGGGTEPRGLRDFVEWRAHLQSVDDLGAFAQIESNLITDDGRGEPVCGVELSASVFRVLPSRGARRKSRRARALVSEPWRCSSSAAS